MDQNIESFLGFWLHYLVETTVPKRYENKSIFVLKLKSWIIYLFNIFFLNYRFYRAALALLCELSVVNPWVFIEAGGVKALTYCLLDTSMSKIAEAILSSLLRLHNDPNIR